MLDLEYLKQFHKIKDVADIIGEIEKLDSLVFKSDWDAVSQHLQNVSQNHMIEKVAYNSCNQLPPSSLQQSAANCRQFLIALGISKIAEEAAKR